MKPVKSAAWYYWDWLFERKWRSYHGKRFQISTWNLHLKHVRVDDEMRRFTLNPSYQQLQDRKRRKRIWQGLIT